MTPTNTGAEASQTVRRAARHQAWLGHTQWAMQYLQHRLEIAGQLALGTLALQGVLVALLADRARGAGGAGRWLVLVAVAALIVAMAFSLQAVVPQQIASLEVGQYRGRWQQEMSGELGSSVEGMFVEAILQGHGQEENDSLAALQEAVRRRYGRVRLALYFTAASVVATGVGAILDTLL